MTMGKGGKGLQTQGSNPRPHANQIETHTSLPLTQLEVFIGRTGSKHDINLFYVYPSPARPEIWV